MSKKAYVYSESQISRGKKQLYGKGNCEICGAEYWKKSRTQKYCSEECKKEADRRNAKLRTKPYDYDFVLDMETWEWKPK